MDYRTVRQIARGGMGLVLLCEVVSAELRLKSLGKYCIAKRSTVSSARNAETMFQQEMVVRKGCTVTTATSFVDLYNPCSHPRQAVSYHIKDHVNIAKAIGFSIKGPEMTMLMRFYECGSLFDLTMRRREVPFEWTTGQVYDFAKDIASGLRHLHERKIAHCDIKSQNVGGREAGRHHVRSISNSHATHRSSFTKKALVIRPFSRILA